MLFGPDGAMDDVLLDRLKQTGLKYRLATEKFRRLSGIAIDTHGSQDSNLADQQVRLMHKEALEAYLRALTEYTGYIVKGTISDSR